MRSTLFQLKFAGPLAVEAVIGKDHIEYQHTVPTLDAYAVEYFAVQVGPLHCLEGSSDRIVGNVLHLRSAFDLKPHACTLLINFHGIRDYARLFPRCQSADMAIRLGQYYEEAEKCFEQAAWLSFALMCGAVFEGLLFSKVGESDDRFESLIDRARAQGAVTDDEALVLHKVRGFRNLVHAKRVHESYVSRADAMDTRRVLDRLVKAI